MACAVGPFATGDEVQGPTYRRVFVPAHSPELWPDDGQRRLPVERSEFERMVRKAKERSIAQPVSEPRLATAEYEARLISIEGQHVLAGRAKFDVQWVGDGDRLVSLSPMNLAISQGHWERSGEPAQIGLWQSELQKELAYGLLAHRQDRLLLQWQQVSENASGEELSFALHLPPAVQQQFILSVPRDYGVRVEPGWGVKAEDAEHTAERRWRLSLLGGAEHHLRLIPPVSAAGPVVNQRVSVVESYALAPHGLEYEGQFRVESVDAGGSLRFVQRGELSITDVNVNGQSIKFRSSPESPDAFVVDVPSLSPASVITIRGSSALQLGSRWELPGVRLSNASWKEGATTLRVDSRLELQNLRTDGAELIHRVGVDLPKAELKDTAVAAAPAPLPREASNRPWRGEVYRLQSEREDARMEIVLAECVAKLGGSLDALVEFAPQGEEVVAHATWELRSLVGDVFHFAADVADPWVIEAVESEPEEAISDWHVTPAETTSGRLHVELRNSPQAQIPTLIRASARAPRQRFDNAITVNQLDWLRARDVRLDRQWLRIQSGQGRIEATSSLGRASLPPDSVPSFALRRPQRWGALEAASKTSEFAGLMIDLGVADPQAYLRLVPAEATFDASSWTTLTGRGGECEQISELLIEPQGGALTELEVEFRRPLPESAAWRCDRPSVTLQAVLVDGEEEMDESSRHRYRLILSSPLASPFRLTCAYRERGNLFGANVPALKGAKKSTGWAVMRGNPQDFEVAASGATPVASPIDSSPINSGTLGAFRVDLDAESMPALQRKRRSDASPAIHGDKASESNVGAGAIAWRVSAHTISHPDGSRECTVRYLLENDSASYVAIEMPEGCTLQSARLDDSAVAPETVTLADVGHWNRFSLPPSERFVALTLVLQGGGVPWGATSTIEAELPKTSFRVVTGDWTAWFPPSYRATGTFPEARGTESSFSHRVPTWRSSDRFVGPGGWHKVVQNFAVAPLSVSVRSESAARAVRWVGGLAVFALTLWLAKRQPRWIALAALGCVVALLLGGDRLWEAPQSMLCGIVVGLAARAATARHRVQEGEMSRASQGMDSHWVRVGIALVAVSACETTQGAPPVPDPLPAAIYYPIDKAGEGVGNDVYVPELLWREWSSRQRSPVLASSRFVITGVDYELDLRRNSRASDATSSPQGMSVRIESLAPEVEVTLPLRKQDADWEAVAARLDGRATELRWAPDGASCKFLAAKPGFHELRLGFVPKIIHESEVSRFSLQTLSFPGAAATLLYDDNMRIPRISGAVSLEKTAATNRLRAVLAPSPQFKVEWRPASREDDLRIVVDERSVLKIEPADAVLHVRWRISGESFPTTNRVQLMVPSDLTLLPLPDGSPVDEVEAFPGRETSIQLHIRPTVRLPFDMSLSFRVQRASSTGKFHFPDVKMRGVQTARRRFAVAIADRLTYRVGTSVGLQEIPRDEFAEEKDASSDKAQLMYAVIQEPPRWSLLVRPQAASPQFKETIRVACEANRAKVDWVADIVAPGSPRQLLNLTLGAATQLENVAVQDAQGKNAGCRWTQRSDDRDQATLFFDRPLASGDRIKVSGWVDYDKQGVFTTPSPIFDVERPGAVEMEIYRLVDVAAQWQTPTIVPPIASGPPLTALGKYAVVGRYRLAREHEGSPIRVERNRRQMSAELATAVTQRDGTSFAHLCIAGKIGGGVFDRICINAPANLGPPYACRPHAEVVVRPNPFDSRRQFLTILLGETYAQSDAISLCLSGVLNTTAEKRVVVPKFSLEDVEAVRQFVVLPQSWDQRRVQWRHPGLQVAALPNRLTEIAPDVYQGLAYEALSPPDFYAEQKPISSARSQSKVAHASGVVQIDADGSWEATVRLALQPADASEAEFSLPQEVELLRAAVDGNTELVVPQSEGSWRCLLGPPNMPRMIEICYRSVATDQWRPKTLVVPLVKSGDQSLVVSSMLWKAAGALGPRQFRLLGGTELEPTEFLRRERLRLESVQREADSIATQLPSWESQQWSENWHVSLRTMRPASGSSLFLEQGTEPLRIAPHVSWQERLRPLGALLIGGLGLYLIWNERQK